MPACARSTVRIRVTRRVYRRGRTQPNQTAQVRCPFHPRESLFRGFGSSVRAELCLPLHAMLTAYPFCVVVVCPS